MIYVMLRKKNTEITLSQDWYVCESVCEKVRKRE